MDLEPETIQNIFKCISVVIALVLVLLVRRRRANKYKNLPPGPSGLPVLGYLPFLGNEPFRKLNDLGKKYGNVFSLYMGGTYTVILGDYEAVKEAFSKTTTLDRPENAFSFLPGGVGFSSINGEEWLEQRKFCTRVMRNIGIGKHKWEELITEEVNELIQTISEWNGRPSDFKETVTSSVSNNIASLVLGKKLPKGHPEREFLNQGIDAVSQFFAQSGLHIYFPTICEFFTKFRIGGYDKRFNDMISFKDYLRREAESRDISTIDPESSSFIEQYMHEMKVRRESGAKHYFNDINLFGNTIALLVGASDTTRTSLNWLFIAMAIHTDVQEKVRAELDNVLGTRNMACWSDRLQLPYTYATLMEGQRWKTVAPLNTSRIAQEDIQICGYDIPKGATIIANNWALHNDRKYWKEPEKFQPERFFLDDGTLNWKPESYVPFSYGKRNCPGETVAMMEIFLYFSGIIKNFMLEPSILGEKLDTNAILGLTYQPEKTVLRFTPRKN